MASTIDDIMPVVRPLWALHQRLLAHTAPGGMLYPMRLDLIGTMEPQGQKDLPILQYIGIEEAEDQAAVGGAGNSKVDIYRVRFAVQTFINYGVFRLDPVEDQSQLGMIEWTALVRDAIECKADRTLDPLFTEYGERATLYKPCVFTTEDADKGQLVWENILVVEMWTQLYFPGNRTCISRGELATP